MAAINKALHIPSIDQDLVIWTDSKSSIDLINSSRLHVSKALRCSARPYLFSILHILNLRDTVGSTSSILHVPSHTGARSRRAIGNADADHKAKQATHDQDPTPDPNHHMDLARFELPIIVHNMKYDPTSADPLTILTFSPIYGDLRAELTHNLKNLLFKEWTNLSSRGVIPASFPITTRNLMDPI